MEVVGTGELCLAELGACMEGGLSRYSASQKRDKYPCPIHVEKGLISGENSQYKGSVKFTAELAHLSFLRHVSSYMPRLNGLLSKFSNNQRKTCQNKL